HVEQQANTARQGFQEPDMRDRSGEVDMTHAFPANLGYRDFDTAFFADDAFIFHALIFAAQTFVIFYRAKDARTEQTVTFWFERPVVDGFRLFDFTECPATNALWRCKANLNLVKCFRLCDRVCEICYLVHFFFLRGL